MASVTQPGSLDRRRRHILLAIPDPWVLYCLRREFEQMGCDVERLSKLFPESFRGWSAFDVVVADAALFPEDSRLEALRALRAHSPSACFILLTGGGDGRLGVVARQSGFDLVLPRPARPEEITSAAREALEIAAPSPIDLVRIGRGVNFSLVSEAELGRKTGSAIVALAFHVVFLLGLLLIPLLYIEQLDVRQLAGFLLVAPPPPPPPPPVAARVLTAARRVKPVFQTAQGKLIAPAYIPDEIAEIVDPEDVVVDVSGVAGGVVGGVPGGQMGGVIGGVIGGIPSSAPPPLPPPTEPVRVGGHIQPPRLIRRVPPVYPPLAAQTRLQGDVRIDAVIDAGGRVVKMKVISGHPLLIRAALQAVERWLYEPTLLNNQPIPVLLEVTVQFRLR